MSALLETALSYAARGWYVFPVDIPTAGNPQSGKRPVGHLVPRGKDDATTDPDVIRAWWGRGDWNIGIAAEPSGLVFLDVDVSIKTDGTQKQGLASLAKIDAQLSPTLTIRTGSGGIHGYYARPAGAELQQNLAFDEGLDLIGKGYVVAPPSRHYTGGSYVVTNALPIVELPPVLRDLRRATPTVAAADVGGKIVEGGRNNAMFKLGCAMRANGATHAGLLAYLLAENRERFNPPLSEHEVSQIAQSVMNRAEVVRDAAIGGIVAETFAAAPSATSALPGAAYATELVDSMYAQADAPTVSVEFGMLNNRLGGLAVHSITNLIAGTGKGKSSYATQWSVYHARQHGPVIYYVGEMTRQAILARMVGQILGVGWLDVIKGKVSRDEVEACLAGLPLIFVARCDDPMGAIAEACGRAQADGVKGIPLIVIDYIQLLATIGPDMRNATAKAVRDVQAFVETAPVIAVVLSQMGRTNSDKAKGNVDNAEDMGGVGAETAELERAATNQLVLSYASKDGAEVHDVTMLITKSRYGGGSRLGFRFNGRTGVWSALEKPPADDSHAQRVADVVLQVKIHASKQCIGGHPCGKPLTANAMALSSSPHRVMGNTKAIGLAVADALTLKQIAKLGNELYLPPE